MTQQLNEELLKFAGFKIRDDAPTLRYAGDKLWEYPDKTKYGEKHYEERPPYFPNSLDACFKWLVPGVHYIKIEKVRGEFGVEAGNFYGRFHRVEDKSPTLALCLAIKKLIDSELKE
jgi:hypothetical protein